MVLQVSAKVGLGKNCLMLNVYRTSPASQGQFTIDIENDALIFYFFAVCAKNVGFPLFKS